MISGKSLRTIYLSSLFASSMTLLIGFQNCAETQFSEVAAKADSSVSDETNMVEAIDENNGGGSNVGGLGGPNSDDPLAYQDDDDSMPDGDDPNMGGDGDDPNGGGDDDPMAGGGDSNGGGDDPNMGGGGDPEPPKDVDPIVQNCAQGEQDGTLLTLNTQVTFDDTKVESGRNQVCQFGVNGNLGILNGYQQARYEQLRQIQLPEGAELCDITFQMDRQNMKYDDMFYMSFNGYMLASNARNVVVGNSGNSGFNTVPAALTDQTLVPLYQYDWSRVAGASFNNSGGTDYCAGEDQGKASCTWPDTEQTGDFIFSYDSELLVNLGAKSADNIHNLRFVITGDNDLNIDCYHEEFNFDVNIKYYINSDSEANMVAGQ